MQSGGRLFGLCVLVVCLTQFGSGWAGDESVAKDFSVFCASWMEKLAARETDNVQTVKWLPSDGGVTGEYVGYSTEHSCDLKLPQGNGGVPIGKISYREMRYRKRGPSSEVAASSSPEIIEITEVTEIFRCDRGKWVY